MVGVVGVMLGGAGGVHAQDSRAPVRITIGACLDDERDAIHHAIRVELGDRLADDDDPGAVAVTVACAAAGLEAGLVLEVRQPGKARLYRYALDWHAQPPDARPRLLGLAVAEAVDASRIELTALPDPVLPSLPAPVIPPAAPPAPSGWRIALVGHLRRFTAHNGVEMVGAGLAPTRRLSTHLYLAADLIGEGTTVLTDSGAIAVRSMSSAPRLAYRSVGRVHGEIGLGARIGVVRSHGEARPRSQLAGASLVRAWWGPVATLAIGADVTPRVAIIASAELGIVAAGSTARDLGEPIAVLDSAWTSFGVAASIGL